jgi:hypothetical protein
VGKIQPGLDAGYSPPSHAGAKTERGYISSLPKAPLMACGGSRVCVRARICKMFLFLVLSSCFFIFPIF